MTDSEKHCEACAQDLRPIGEESSERYEYIPAQLMVIEDVCKKYACECAVKTATKPPCLEAELSDQITKVNTQVMRPFTS